MWLKSIWLHRYMTELFKKTIHCCPPDIPVNGGCGGTLNFSEWQFRSFWDLTNADTLTDSASKLEMHRKAGFVHQESFPEGASMPLPQQFNSQLWKGCAEGLFIWEMLLFLVDWQFFPWNIKQNAASKCSKMLMCQKYLGLSFSLKRNVSFFFCTFLSYSQGRTEFICSRPRNS